MPPAYEGPCSCPVYIHEPCMSSMIHQKTLLNGRLSVCALQQVALFIKPKRLMIVLFIKAV